MYIYIYTLFRCATFICEHAKLNFICGLFHTPFLPTIHACNYRSSTTGTHTLMMPSISVLCHMHESITNRLSSNIESVC